MSETFESGEAELENKSLQNLKRFNEKNDLLVF